jgi:hypothetical protein
MSESRGGFTGAPFFAVYAKSGDLGYCSWFRSGDFGAVTLLCLPHSA